MTATISRVYDDFDTARQVVADLEAAGLRSNDISIVARDERMVRSKQADPRHDSDRDGRDDRGEGAAIGAGIGATAGGAAGLLAGLGIMAIPGVGPVVAAGWLTATAIGALAGGTAGGLIGALTQAGVSEKDAHVYAETVRRGGALVSARVPDDERRRYESIMDRSAVNIASRRTEYEMKGWTRFDPSLAPHADDADVRPYREEHLRDGGV